MSNPFNITHGETIYTKDTSWTLPLDGLDAAGGRVEVYINGELFEFSIDDNDKYTIDFGQPLPAGKHVIQVMTFDKAENPSPPWVFVLDVDTTEPVKPEILRAIDDNGTEPYYLTSGEVTKDGAPKLTGSAEPGSKVKLMNGNDQVGEAEVDSLGRWEFTPDLKEGTNTFTVVSTDKAGNESTSDAFNLYLNEKPADAPEEVERQPSVQPVAKESATQEEGTPADPEKPEVPEQLVPQLSSTGVLSFQNYKVEPKDEGGTVEVVIDGEIYTTTIKDLKWSMPDFQLADGLHVVQVRYIDLAENVGVPLQFLFEVDATPPEKPEILQVYDDANDRNLSPMGSTKDTGPTLIGVSEPESLVYVYRGTNEIGSVYADKNGRWEFDTAPLNLTGSYHSFTVKAEDKYQRQSVASDAFVVNIDVSAPLKPTISGAYDDFGDTINLASGARTDDDRPTFSGQSEAGTLVTIYVNGEAVASTYADAITGDWTLDAPLETGNNVINVVAKDKAGNKSPVSDDFVLTLAEDPIKPIIGEVINNDGDEPIVIANGAATNDKTPKLTGTGVDGDIVTVYLDGQPVGSTTVKEGKWSFVVPEMEDLQDGNHELTIKVTDEFNQTSEESDPFKFKLDTQAPDAIDIGAGSVVDDEDNPIEEGSTIGDDTPTFIGEGTDGDLITIVDKEGKPIGSAVVEDGRWEITPEEGLDDGEYDFGIIVTDPAGNESEPSDDPFKLIIDTQAPENLTDLKLSDNTGPITDPITGDPGYTDELRPELSGKGEAGSMVIIFVDGKEVATVKVEADGSWSWKPEEDMATGSHNFAAQPVDDVGNRGDKTAPINVVINNSPVSLSGLIVSDSVGTYTENLVSGGQTDDTTPTFSGSATDGSIVYIRDKVNNTIIGSAQVTDGAWTFTPEPALAEREYDLEIYAQSQSGVQSLKQDFKFTVDLSSPEAPVVGTDFDIWDDVGSITGPIAAGGDTDDEKPEIKGKAEPGEVIFIYADGASDAIASVRVEASGEWSWQPETDLGEGKHSYQVAIRDVAGNMGAKSDALEFTVDIREPTGGRLTNFWTNIGGEDKGAMVQPGKTASVKDNTPVFTGIGEPGALVTIHARDSDTIVGSAFVQENSTWRIETSKLDDMTYDFVIDFTDKAGNTSSVDVGFMVDIDTTNPGKPGIGSRGLFEIDEQGAALSVDDVLQHGQQDLFINSGTTQLMVTGKKGAVLNLEDLTGEQDAWQQANGSVTIGGVEYNVFQNATTEMELLVQQDINTQL